MVEGTAGNTGIGLALVGNAMGFRTVIVIPETQSQEKKDMLRLAGAELIQVPAAPYRNPNNYVRYSGRLAEELSKSDPNGVIWANQFDNTANRQAHVEGTGPEIWAQTQGKVDGFICAVGTGGTLAGTAMALQPKGVKIGLADPDGAALHAFYTEGRLESHGDSITEGIGQGRITANLEGFTPDFSYNIPDAEALPIVFDLLTEEGLCLGGSSGINIAGAMRMAREMGPGHTIVTILCDYGTRISPSSSTPTSSRPRVCRCRAGSTAAPPRSRASSRTHDPAPARAASDRAGADGRAVCRCGSGAGRQRARNTDVWPRRPVAPPRGCGVGCTAPGEAGFIGPPAPPELASRVDFAAWQRTAARAEMLSEAGRGSQFALERLRSDLVAWRGRVRLGASANGGRIRTVQAQLAALGPAPAEPAEGEPPADSEASAVTQRRAELESQLARLRAPVLLAEEPMPMRDGLVAEIDGMIRARGLAGLFERGPSPLAPSSWTEAAEALTARIGSINGELAASWRSASRREAFMAVPAGCDGAGRQRCRPSGIWDALVAPARRAGRRTRRAGARSLVHAPVARSNPDATGGRAARHRCAGPDRTAGVPDRASHHGPTAGSGQHLARPMAGRPALHQ